MKRNGSFFFGGFKFFFNDLKADTSMSVMRWSGGVRRHEKQSLLHFFFFFFLNFRSNLHQFFLMNFNITLHYD